MIGDKVILHSYKHDRTLHRVWKTEVILEDNKDMIIVANKKTKVIEDNGRFWYTKEPSVSFFFKKHWFNVIGIIKKSGIEFYCNISSPILLDDEALKYIDYDLDIKVNNHYKYNVLDLNEYNRNQASMHYPEAVKEILLIELNTLKKMIEDRAFPFQNEIIMRWYKKYLELEES